MELRFLIVMTGEFKDKKPRLQYRNNSDEGWTDVPTTILWNDEFDENTGLP